VKRAAVVGLAAGAVAAVTGPAWAYFTVATSAAGPTAVAGALGTPSLALAGPPSATAVALAVGAPASGVAPAGYRVDRTAPTVAAGVCSLAAPGTCTDSAPVAGQTNTYAVYALRHAWASLSPATLDVAVPADTRSYSLTPSTTTPTAGTAFTITVTASETSYSGTKSVTWSGGQTVGSYAPSYPSSLTFANGVATATVTLYHASAQTLVVTDATTPAYTGSTSLTVSRASVALSLTCPASAPKGTAVTATLARPAADAYGNPVTGQPVAVTVSATFASPASQTVTIAAAATSQVFGVTLSTAANRTTVLSTNAPAGYTAASCSTVHT
jgi:hypothetical protein